MGRAYLTLLPVILLWASTPLLVSELSRELPAAQINVLTGAFAVLMLALILGLSGRWRQLHAYSRKDYARMILLGLTGIFPYTSLYYLAFSLAPSEAGSINIMNYLWPVWMLVLSSFILKEALNWRKVLGLLLSFCGVTLIVTGGLRLRLALESLPAYLAAGCGAFFWALFSVLSKRYAFEPLSSMLVFNVAALPCSSWPWP
jgi:drug/metabolite transporter (DMT)-like permease